MSTGKLLRLVRQTYKERARVKPPQKVLPDGWLAGCDGRLGRSLIWTLAGLSAAKVFAFTRMLCEASPPYTPDTMDQCQGVGGTRIHWHGEFHGDVA